MEYRIVRGDAIAKAIKDGFVCVARRDTYDGSILTWEKTIPPRNKVIRYEICECNDGTSYTL